jgi:hypothetical protein
MKPDLLLRIGAVFIACAVASTSVAKEKRKKKAHDSHPTVITAVTPQAISIREAKAEKTVAITPATEIYVRDRKADVAALQPWHGCEHHSGDGRRQGQSDQRYGPAARPRRQGRAVEEEAPLTCGIT